MGVASVKIAQGVTAYSFLLGFTFLSLSLFVTALRELTLLLEPPFRAKFGTRWRFAVNKAERGVSNRRKCAIQVFYRKLIWKAEFCCRSGKRPGCVCGWMGS